MGYAKFRWVWGCNCALILRIRDLLTKNWENKLMHAWRLGNQRADYLAKQALMIESMQVLQQPLIALRDLLSRDVTGVLTLGYCS